VNDRSYLQNQMFVVCCGADGVNVVNDRSYLQNGMSVVALKGLMLCILQNGSLSWR
jgi:hypothetical protein